MPYSYPTRYPNENPEVAVLAMLLPEVKKLREAQVKSGQRNKAQVWSVSNFVSNSKSFGTVPVTTDFANQEKFPIHKLSTSHKALESFVQLFIAEVSPLADNSLAFGETLYRRVHQQTDESVVGHLDKQVLKNLSKLSSFATLKKGWDGYNAVPVSKELIDFCKLLIVSLPKNSQPDIFPTPRGTIQLEYEDKERYLEIEVSLDAFNIYGTKPRDQVLEGAYIDWDSVLKAIEWVNAEH